MAGAGKKLIREGDVDKNLSLYKSFPKYDPRRYFVVLDAMARLKDRATLHYIAMDIGASRSEVDRAIEAMPAQLGVEIEKVGTAYRLQSWGVLKPKSVEALLRK